MKKFQLELWLQIIGIGSASGLVFKDNSIFLISDNSSLLYEYEIATKKLATIPLFETGQNESVNIAKPLKPDFESVTASGDSLFVFGSGSTSNRNQLVTITNQKSQSADLSDLYLSMQYFANIQPGDFNIEGVVRDQDNWYFFQRGNGPAQQNGVFTVSGDLLGGHSILYKSFRLPEINGIQASFTDAVLVGETVYFLAAAEDTNSTYADGEVLGTIIGSLNIETMKIGFTQQISETHKFEGLTFYKSDDKTIQFLLCEDKDSDILQTDIYTLTINN